MSMMNELNQKELQFSEKSDRQGSDGRKNRQFFSQMVHHKLKALDCNLDGSNQAGSYEETKTLKGVIFVH